MHTTVLQPGAPVPAALRAALQARGLGDGPCVVGVVKEGCAACEDALPLLDAALDAGWGEGAEKAVVVFAEEDAPTTDRLRAEYAPATPLAPDPEPYAVSRSLGTEFTPSFWRVEHGTLVDVCEGFDPAGLQRLLRGLSVSQGMEPFELFAPGEALPRFRPG